MVDVLIEARFVDYDLSQFLEKLVEDGRHFEKIGGVPVAHGMVA